MRDSAVVAGTAFYLVGRNAHNRAANQVNTQLEYAAPISKKLATAGAFLYLHPALGWRHGALKFLGKDNHNWKHGLGKAAIHAGGVVAAVAIFRRV